MNNGLHDAQGMIGLPLAAASCRGKRPSAASFAREQGTLPIVGAGLVNGKQIRGPAGRDKKGSLRRWKKR